MLWSPSGAGAEAATRRETWSAGAGPGPRPAARWAAAVCPARVALERGGTVAMKVMKRFAPRRRPVGRALPNLDAVQGPCPGFPRGPMRVMSLRLSFTVCEVGTLGALARPDLPSQDGLQGSTQKMESGLLCQPQSNVKMVLLFLLVFFFFSFFFPLAVPGMEPTALLVVGSATESQPQSGVSLKLENWTAKGSREGSWAGAAVPAHQTQCPGAGLQASSEPGDESRPAGAGRHSSGRGTRAPVPRGTRAAGPALPRGA